MNSYSLQEALDASEYAFGTNVVCRGGIVQTRPGSQIKFMCPDGNFQGCTLFRTTGGTSNLVFAVDGAIYVSPAPFTGFTQLTDLQFSPTSRQIAWATCLQSTDYTPITGELFFLDNPKPVLVIQDSLTRAAYWDGSTARHLNPTHSNQEATQEGFDETPVGLWMAWSNNRLWLSRGNQIFASDIGNPLKFTESQYLNEGRAFYLSGDCTGIIETPDQAGIIAFTEDNGSFIQSSIQDRTQWLDTPGFQKTILPQTGCAAPRSLITQYGLLWWFSPQGLTNINAALRQNLSSRLDLQDNEMYASKAFISPGLDVICGVSHENYLLMSVPHGDVTNRHTWCMDQAVFDGPVNSWNSIWTGWRPIEWTRGAVNGRDRVFFGSKDYDGHNRIWEAFTADRMDNRTPISCSVVTREHMFQSMDMKKFRYAEIFLKEMLGTVNMGVWAQGRHGVPKQIAAVRMVSTPGQVYTTESYPVDETNIVANLTQNRVLKTCELNSEDTDCFECGVQANTPVVIDKAFSLILNWEGRCGFSGYRVFANQESENYTGTQQANEVAPNAKNALLCVKKDFLFVTDPFTHYTSTKTFTYQAVSATETAQSIISQQAADDSALSRATSAVNHIVGG